MSGSNSIISFGKIKLSQGKSLTYTNASYELVLRSEKEFIHIELTQEGDFGVESDIVSRGKVEFKYAASSKLTHTARFHLFRNQLWLLLDSSKNSDNDLIEGEQPSQVKDDIRYTFCWLLDVTSSEIKELKSFKCLVPEIDHFHSGWKITAQRVPIVVIPYRIPRLIEATTYFNLSGRCGSCKWFNSDKEEYHCTLPSDQENLKLKAYRDAHTRPNYSCEFYEFDESYGSELDEISLVDEFPDNGTCKNCRAAYVERLKEVCYLGSTDSEGRIRGYNFRPEFTCNRWELKQEVKKQKSSDPHELEWQTNHRPTWNDPKRDLSSKNPPANQDAKKPDKASISPSESENRVIRTTGKNRHSDKQSNNTEQPPKLIRSEQELQEFYETELKHLMTAVNDTQARINQVRKRTKIKMWVYFSISLFLLISMVIEFTGTPFLLSWLAQYNGVVAAMVVFVGFLVSTTFGVYCIVEMVGEKKRKSFTWSVFAREVLPTFLTKTFPHIVYSNEDLSVKKLPVGGRFDPFDKREKANYNKDHAFKGKLHDMRVEFGYLDVHERQRFKGKTKNVQVWDGTVVFVDFNKAFEGTTVVRDSRNRLKELREQFDREGGNYSLDEIHLVDPDFDKLYNVYSDNQTYARFLINPGEMEQLKKVYKLTNYPVDYCFQNKQLTIALNNNSPIGAFDRNRAEINFEDIRLLWTRLKDIENIVELLKYGTSS